MIVIFDQGLDDTKSSKPSCRVDQERVDSPELSELLFELHVIPRIKISKYLVAPKAKGLPAELTPKLVAAYIAASLAKSFFANPK